MTTWDLKCVASYESCRAVRAPRGRTTARDEPQINKIVKCEGNRNSMSGTSVPSKTTYADNYAVVTNFTIPYCISKRF